MYTDVRAGFMDLPVAGVDECTSVKSPAIHLVDNYDAVRNVLLIQELIKIRGKL